MKTVLLFAALALLACPALPNPAHATPAPEDAVPACAWPNSNPMPDGTSTSITNCMISGHPVRINATIVGVAGDTEGCKFANSGLVSAWVDGVKVMDRRYTDGPGWCEDGKAKLVNAISIDDRLNLTLCETLPGTIRGDAYPDNDIEITDPASGTMVHARSACTTTALATPATADPLYGLRTPPGLVNDMADSNDCSAFTEAFHDPDTYMLGSVLDSYETGILALDGTPYETASSEEEAKGSITQYQIELDGDDVADTVSKTETSHADGMSSVSYSWRHGASGQDYRIDAARLGVTGDVDDLTGLAFVNINGNIYLYYTVFDAGSDGGSFLAKTETEYGARDDATLFGFTRRAYRLLPDGTAKVVCQWSPRKRPEEFM